MINKIVSVLTKFVDFLDGKKTFIGGTIVFIGGGLKSINKIDDNTFKVIEAIGGAITVFGIRHAISKLK